MNILAPPTALSDADLLSRLGQLARNERAATVDLITHLAELDARKLYRAEGYGSLFRYCTDALRLSEHAAYARVEAAHIARAFPVVLDRLADGSLNLTTLCLVAPHLRPENHVAVLARAAGGSKRDVQALVARLAPRPDVPASVRKLPADRAPEDVPALSAERPVSPPVQAQQPRTIEPRSDPVMTTDPVTKSNEAGTDLSSSVNGLSPGFPSVSLLGPLPSSHRPLVVPSAPARYRIQFTIAEETHDKLRLLQDLLRREIPDGDPAAIFDRALTLLLAETARRKVGATSSPGPRRKVGATSSPGPGWRASASHRSASASRHIPAAVKRAVWLRDRAQCAFVGKTGRRCAERAYLEFHHIEPYAVGGEASTGNISLRCRSHNAFEAEAAFGTEVVAARQSAARKSTRSGPSTKGNTRRPAADP